jgi:hypothetical protein
LFVTNQNIPPGQKVEKLPVAPEVFPVAALGMPGFNYKFSIVHATNLLKK